jgi:hypothetical protein
MLGKLNRSYLANFDVLLIILLVFHMAGNNIFIDRYLVFTIGIIYAIRFLRISKGISPNILWLLTAWIFINLIASIFVIRIPIIRFLILTVYLFMPYFVLSVLGRNFWVIFEKIVFILTFLSIPLFILNNLFVSFFNQLEPLFSFLLFDAFEYNSGHIYWTSLIYSSGFGEGLFGLRRNLGFMWEPGAFAMMIVWAICFNWMTKGVKLSKKIIIYFIALITTFSTAGFLAMIVLIIVYSISKKSLRALLLTPIIIVIFYFTVYDTNVFSGKFEIMIESIIEDPTGEKGHIEAKVSRFQGAVTSFIRFLDYPLGYGLISKEDVGNMYFSYGVNGIMSALEIWGIVFVLVLAMLYRGFTSFNATRLDKWILRLLFFSLFIMFISNPIQRHLLFYFILFNSTTANRAFKTG